MFSISFPGRRLPAVALAAALIAPPHVALAPGSPGQSLGIASVPNLRAKGLQRAAVVKNPTRYWLMDSFWLYGAGETHDFDGIKATWMAKLEMKTGAIQEHKKTPFPAYKPTVVARHSKFLWLKGSQVYLLQDQNGKVWIMQAYTNMVDKTLTQAGLPSLGSKLKLPPEWKYEVKTLDRDFTYIPPASTGYLTHAVADDLQNVYQGCGFDDACNYIP